MRILEHYLEVKNKETKKNPKTKQKKNQQRTKKDKKIT